jgi:hypothetical protein
MLAHGMPPRDNDTERRVRDLERQISQLNGMIVQAANAGNAWAGRTVGVQDDDDTATLTGSWAPYLVNTIAVPDGFTQAVVNVFCSTGATFSGAGNGIVGAAAAISGFDGPLISNGLIIPAGGGSSACSVTSAFTAVIAVTPGGSFQVGINAYASGSSSIVAGSDNVHLSVSVIFTR